MVSYLIPRRHLTCCRQLQPVINSDQSRKLFVYTPRGQSIDVIPSTCVSVRLKLYARWLNGFIIMRHIQGEELNRILTAQFAQVLDAYIGGKAIFLLDDPRTSIRVISHDELESAPALERVAFYNKTPVLVVTGDVVAKARFDDAGLEEIQDLDAICTVQGEKTLQMEWRPSSVHVVFVSRSDVLSLRRGKDDGSLHK